MKLFFPLILLLLTGGAGKAQDALQFSLAEAKEYALKNSYVVRNSGLDVASAKKKVWETIADGLPQIEGSAAYNNYLNLPTQLIPGEFFGQPAGTYIEVQFGQEYDSRFGFTVNQLLFDGSYLVGVGSAKIYLQLAGQSKEKTELDILHAVEQAYYSVLVAEENLVVMKENLANSEKLERDSRMMYQNGFVEEQDVDQTKLLVQKGENEILKTQREIRVARMVLKYTMGVDMDTEVRLTDKLANFVDPLLAEKEKAASGFDYTSHIDYRLLDTQRQANKKLLLNEKAGYLPKISAFYDWNKTAYGNSANLFKDNVPWYKSSMWGINVTVPIFSSGQRMAKVRQAALELEKAENNQKQSMQQLQKDYLTAVGDMQSSVEQLKNDQDNKQLAKRIYEKTVVKYNNGITGSTDLSQTEGQYIQAQSAWVNSVMQLLTSKINLDKATGK
ncbi:MAG: TolC family protein [Mangrovibacterium sp.]